MQAYEYFDTTLHGPSTTHLTPDWQHSFFKILEVLKLINFWAPWSGPYKTMTPVFKRIASQLEPKFRFAKLNTETEQAIGAQYQILSIPTLILFQNGQEIAR